MQRFLRIMLGASVLAAALVPASAASAQHLDSAVSPVIVAVVDTGVDASQPMLAGRIVGGYDAIGGGTATEDGGWHGTAIASIVAGASGAGVTSYCDPCRVMPVKALSGGGLGHDADIARGIRWAVDHGARVLNLSLEGTAEEPVLHEALRYANANGVVVVAAAGNLGTTSLTYPAADPFAIGVAAIDASSRLYPWSNRGRWVTVAAPGVDLSGVPGGGTFAFAGTSAAAAVVSGTAGLCLTAAPTLSPALVRRALVETATPIAGARFGRIDPARTVELCRRLAAN